MNKQELNGKWSKYCNCEKLVDDTVALLKKYGHRTTEEGVCALLDKYFSNKKPLIEMFMTSKNYIGDMRIAVDKEFMRNINSNELWNFFKGIEEKMNARDLLQFADDEGKTMSNYLATGKKTLGIDDLPSQKEQKDKNAKLNKFDFSTMATKQSAVTHSDFLAYMRYFQSSPYVTIQRDYILSKENNTPLLKKGTKTSRAFNAVCTYYGVDKFRPETKVVNGVNKTVYPYDKVFAAYSDLVSNLTRKLKFVISLNPLDYLTMSNGVNWISCHNIRSGGCMGGTLSYMLDKVSIITFVVDNLNGDIHMIPKVYRQMYHYENNLFIQSRLYPQGNDGATNLYDRFRTFMMEEFNDLLGANNEWKCLDGASGNYKEGQNAMHYPDYRYNRNASRFYPANNEPSASKHVMTIGHNGICVHCGKPYSGSGRLAHYSDRECNNA